MASIAISDLRPAGSELFVDSETFINELTSEELSLTSVQGGASFVIWGVAIASKYVYSAFASGAAVGAISALAR